MEITYPIRLNRYLYLKGITSRRQADRFIEQGLIKVNGIKAVLGQKISAEDIVELGPEVHKYVRSYEYYAFNKPRGIVSHNPQEGEMAVEDVFNLKHTPLFPIGRLDKDSDGLMILTNDGRIVDKMLNPKFDHEKEYVVSVDKPLKPSFANKMSRGVNIEGYMTKPAKVRLTGEHTFRILLTEGKKHQIRRMCAALGYQVKRLRRVRIMNIKLKNLPVGKARKLTPDEVELLLSSLGMKTT
jgi:23S rRNA pseudouridine2604 synthase